MYPRDLFHGLAPSLQPWSAIYVGQDSQRQALCQVNPTELAGWLAAWLPGWLAG